MGYFKSVNRKKRKQRNVFLVIIVFLFLMLIFLFKAKLKVSDKYISKVVLGYFWLEAKNINNEQETVINKTNVNTIKEPLVYIYNTHQTEKYAYNKINVYNIDYDVTFASQILKANLDSLGIYSIVETISFSDLLKEKQLSYGHSYEISRLFLEQSIINYPSLRFFIDLHRDSASYEVTTCIINDKKFAKILFVIGLENPNYLKNEELINYLDNKLKEYNSCLSRGIMKKKGQGVNGVYNQDFNENTILIEVGGQYNTIEEVGNTLDILASILAMKIKESI